MLKWVRSTSAKRDRERKRAREKQEEKREWEREEQKARREREPKEEEAKRAREQRAEKIMAEVMLKEDLDWGDQYLRRPQGLKRRKFGCWTWNCSTDAGSSAF